MNEKTRLECPNCGIYLGYEETIDGVALLNVHGFRLTVLRGVCSCGQEMHWSVSERALALLIKRTKSAREVLKKLE